MRKPPLKPKKGRGRPAAVSEELRAVVLRRLADGERPVDLQREYGISRPTFIRTFSDETTKIKNQAIALATVEMEIERMPFSSQSSIRALADNLKLASNNLAAIAAVGSRTALMLRNKASEQAARLGSDFGEDGVDRQTLRAIMALAQTSNEELRPALEILKTAKIDTAEERPIHTPEQLRRMAELMERKR